MTAWLRKLPVAISISTIIVVISFTIMITREYEWLDEAYIDQLIAELRDMQGIPYDSPCDLRNLAAPLTLSLGSTFDFDNIRITLGETIGWTDINASWSNNDGKDVFYIPITVTNIYSSSHTLNRWLLTMFGPDGLRLDKIDSYFNNDIFFGRNDMRPNATMHSYVHILYDGDGEYVIEFFDWGVYTIEVIFQVQKT